MTDPISIAAGIGTNLISGVLTGVVKKLYTALQHIVKCRKECELFKQQLDSLSNLLNEIEPIFEEQLLNSDFAKVWWVDLKKCLDESLELVSSFRPAPNYDPRNLISKGALRKAIIAKKDELEHLVSDAKIEKGVLIMNYTETKQLAKDVKEMRRDFEVVKEALTQIGKSTKNYMHADGDKQPIVASLTAIKSFSRNEEKDKYPVAESSLQDEHEPLIGRENIIEELEVLLLDAQGPKIIALHGMGGAGKTSIVRALIKRPKVQSYFGTKNVIWAPVGKESELQDFQAKVEKHISFVSELGKDSRLQDFQAEAHEHINEDKHESQVSRLIVLDDLWNTEEVRFVQKKSEFGRHTFLITTRQLGIIEAYTNIKAIHVQVLSESESWNLFKYHAFLFRNEEHILSLEHMAKQVANECKGLPLALKVIGRAMSDKTTIGEWKDALGKLKSQDVIDNHHEEHLIQVLRISYDALASVEKYLGKVRECFLYFGAFEEDAYIEVESLMNLWVGEGLLKNDGNPIDQTYIVLGVLIGSSLIEKHEEDVCQIHDMIRDLALYISRQDRRDEDLFQGPNNWQLDKMDHAKLLRVSCHNHTHIYQGYLDERYLDAKLFAVVKISAPHLKVLMLDGNFVPQKFLDGCCSRLCSLQVLSLARTSGFEHLPNSLGKLQRLVVLNLYGSTIKRLPHSLRKLTKLKFLDLDDCEDLEELPRDAFSDLKNLELLQLPWKWMTRSSGSFTSGWFTRSSKILHQTLIYRNRYFLLKFGDDDATQFRNLLRLTWFSFESAITQLPTFMKNMSQLTILKMNCPIRDLEPLRTLDKLEHLEVLLSQLTSLPDWICQYTFLSKLMVSTRNAAANYLPDMDALSQLRSLSIRGWESLTSFPKLPRSLK